jgi:hypothetical protein
MLARKSAEDDVIVATLTKVAESKELGQFEVAALLEVLNVDPRKWAAHPIFNITQAETDTDKKLHADMLQVIQQEIEGALKWDGSVGPLMSQGYLMQMNELRLKIQWARGFATGQFTEGFWKTNADLRTALDVANPGVYRESFLKLYGPKSADPILANDIAAASSKIEAGIEEGIEVDESSLLGAIVVGLVAIGALVYLTRR